MRRKHLALLFTSILLALLSIAGPCGDPGTWITVDNQTDQTVYIFIDGLQDGEIPAHEVVKYITGLIFPWPDEDDRKILIEAKTRVGQYSIQRWTIIYSESFTWQELDDMDWTIVISPETSD